jgi:hypothetical protein
MKELDPAARAELLELIGDELNYGGTLLRDIALAKRLVELAFTLPDPIARTETIAKASHMVDALLDHVEAVDLPEPMRRAVDEAADRLRLALEDIR